MATKPRTPREPTPQPVEPADLDEQAPDTPPALPEPATDPVVVEDPAPGTHVTISGATYTRADAVLLGLIPPTGG